MVMHVPKLIERLCSEESFHELEDGGGILVGGSEYDDAGIAVRRVVAQIADATVEDSAIRSSPAAARTTTGSLCPASCSSPTVWTS